MSEQDDLERYNEQQALDHYHQEAERERAEAEQCRIDLKQIKERCEKLDDGQWYISRRRDGLSLTGPKSNLAHFGVTESPELEFIQSAKTDVPAMVEWIVNTVDFMQSLSCRCRDGENYETGELITIVCERCKLLSEIQR